VKFPGLKKKKNLDLSNVKIEMHPIKIVYRNSREELEKKREIRKGIKPKKMNGNNRNNKNCKSQ
jgi:hypothetical protein